MSHLGHKSQKREKTMQTTFAVHPDTNVLEAATIVDNYFGGMELAILFNDGTAVKVDEAHIPDPNRRLQKGDRVMVYQRPFTQQEPEGTAIITEIKQEQELGEAYCDVVFDEVEEPNKKYPRTVLAMHVTHPADAVSIPNTIEEFVNLAFPGEDDRIVYAEDDAKKSFELIAVADLIMRLAESYTMKIQLAGQQDDGDRQRQLLARYQADILKIYRACQRFGFYILGSRAFAKELEIANAVTDWANAYMASERSGHHAFTQVMAVDEIVNAGRGTDPTYVFGWSDREEDQQAEREKEWPDLAKKWTFGGFWHQVGYSYQPQAGVALIAIDDEAEDRLLITLKGRDCFGVFIAEGTMTAKEGVRLVKRYEDKSRYTPVVYEGRIIKTGRQYVMAGQWRQEHDPATDTRNPLSFARDTSSWTICLA